MSQLQPQLPQWPRPQSQLPQLSQQFDLFQSPKQEENIDKLLSQIARIINKASDPFTIKKKIADRDEIENELVEAGISLPEKYFVNGRYPKTSRPSARSPNELSDPSGYRLIQKRREKSGQSVAHHLKNHHLSDIFSLWFKYTTDPVLSQEDLNSLKNLIFFAIHCIENHEDARNRFYTHNGDLYMVNNIFNSSSRLNIAASMDLSKYEINYKDYEDELIVCSSSEDEDEGQRTKGTPKKQSTNKRNI
ncbi:unnamed protein product [Rhizophagus irregularis]|nr:unnamed protein product [Rhizophagus irregularis]